VQFVLFAKPTGEHTWDSLEVWMAIFFLKSFISERKGIGNVGHRGSFEHW
jgi:hypothetical protein